MRLRGSGWLAAAAAWTIFGLVSGLQVWVSMVLHGHSVPRLVGYYLLLWEAWLLITVGIVKLVHRWPLIPLNGRNVLINALAATVVAVIHLSYWTALMFAMKPYDRMTPTWQQFQVRELFFYRLPLELVLYLVVAGIAEAIEFSRKSTQLEMSLMSARLQALEMQLQPHFLFNTLNAISSLVRTGQNREAVTMIAGLSDLLRYMLDHAGQQLVSIDDESEMVKRYLEIQRMRFPDRLTFGIEIAADVRRAAVPAFILQPLAENAIRHGSGVVNVRAFREDDRVRIEVFNSGALAESDSGGIGVRNTRERLRQLYGDAQRFELGNAAGGVLAWMTIPWQEAV